MQIRLEEIIFEKLIYQITTREQDPEEMRQASKCQWRQEMRSLEHEKADGDTVRDAGQRVQYERGVGGIITWEGGIMEPWDMAPKERQRNATAPSGSLTVLSESRYLSMNYSIFSTFHLHVLRYVKP